MAVPAPDRVVLGAWGPDAERAEQALACARFWSGADDDLADFHRRFRDDPWIGPSVRARPELRPPRRPDAFEALAWAICEQLIEFDRAVEIQRRIVRRWGHRCDRTGLRDAPDARRLAGVAPAELQACDLAHSRALALLRCAREVAAGRADLEAADPTPALRRLRAIPGIGSWTLSVLALHGHGDLDALPAGDLAYVKLVGRRQAGGRPSARAGEEEVVEAFERFRPYRALAGVHALRLAGQPSGPSSSATASPGRNSVVYGRAAGARSSRPLSAIHRV
jgi:3-methyladenine DNA glycosylase/8-oxoguanine DNA glycosylase